MQSQAHNSSLWSLKNKISHDVKEVQDVRNTSKKGATSRNRELKEERIARSAVVLP